VAERVTLQTIADAVGVSRTTISNATTRPDQLARELWKQVPETAKQRSAARIRFVAAKLANWRRLSRVGSDRLLDDPARQLFVVVTAIAARVGADLGPVDRDHTDRRQARIGTQGEDLAEQRAERALVTQDEARDRGVIGPLMPGDHAARDVFRARAHDRADRVDHEPRQGILGQPTPDVGRQQERLLPITRDDILRHAPDGLKRAGRGGTRSHAIPLQPTTAAQWQAKAGRRQARSSRW
jgi:hypothetical protein